MVVRDNKIYFYGTLAGEIIDGVAHINEAFQCGEMSCGIMELGYKIKWVREGKKEK